MSRPASHSFNSSQRECKYKSVAYWEMRVVTTEVSGQSVSNSLGSSDQDILNGVSIRNGVSHRNDALILWLYDI